jgi:hypothetical protein
MMDGTLLDIFEPPEGLYGHGAALVAMTAERDFLEAAMTRFTGLSPRWRTERGDVFAYLMRDGRASATRRGVFAPQEIPGLHEFQPRQVEPHSLLHAKLALLAFSLSRDRTGPPVCPRLIVHTGNLTYASAKQQLELVWRFDFALAGTGRAEGRADLKAAAGFVEAILARRFYRDEQELAPEERMLTGRLDALLGAVASLAPTNRRPRFIHSLSRPLYDQIRERFRSTIEKPRNLLLCGSGSFEEPATRARKPAVLGRLEDLGVFTANVRRVVLVEPDHAGATAPWAKAGETEGWDVVRPYDALDKSRRLHAKFVYAGFLRDRHVSNGCLYLGSGNLSQRGILTHGGMAEGNVETGVVFAADERLDGDAIKARLFWLDEVEPIGDDEWVVGEPEDAPESQFHIEASPILSASIRLEPSRHLRLFWRDDLPETSHVSISWIGRDWFRVAPGDNVPLKDDENPVALKVRDGERELPVPVVDAEGRVCWQPQRFHTFAEALAALLDFPMRPAEATDDDEDDEADDGDGGGVRGVGGGETFRQEKTYALHHAAELIEKISALQASLSPSMIGDWLDHLDRVFRGSFPEPVIATWRTHRIDIFAHLQDPALRPPNLTDEKQARYFDVLDRVARAWGLR